MSSHADMLGTPKKEEHCFCNDCFKSYTRDFNRDRHEAGCIDKADAAIPSMASGLRKSYQSLVWKYNQPW